MDTHPVPWAGRNHLALITDNLERTTCVWHGVMGAPLVATLGTEAFRPYSFDVGHGATVAFFEYHGHQVDHFAKEAGTPEARAVPFDHVSLHLQDEIALHRLRQRLLAHGCEVTKMVDHGLMRSISVTDPSQVRPARLPCVLCHGRGSAHQGHGTPELIVSMGGNEHGGHSIPARTVSPETLLWPSGPGVTEHAGACIALCALRRWPWNTP